MSVTVNSFHTVDIPAATPLAKVEDATHELVLWPAGVGVGPTIHMSQRDWERLKTSADAAIRAHAYQKRLDGYTAREGNGAEL